MLKRGETSEIDRRYFKKGRKRLFVRIARLMNFICAIFMIVDLVMRIVNLSSGTFKGDVFYYVMMIYLLGFAALLVAAEWRATKVLMYAEFLRGRMGKGFYLFLIGLMIFDDTRKVDMLVGILLVLVGIFNILVSFMRQDPPEEEPAPEDDELYYDDEDYQYGSEEENE